MNIQPVNKTTAELYEVEHSYKRFNQMNNLIIQMYWNEEIKKLENKRQENLQKYIKEKRAGYSLLDFAYFNGPLSFVDNINYGINFCDQKANSWSSDLASGKVDLDVFSPQELTTAIKKASSMYGASDVGIAPLDRRWFYSHWFDHNTKKSYPIHFSDEDEKYSYIKEPTLLENNIRVIPKEMKSVIVFIFEMSNECLKRSPTILPYGEGVNVYSKMSLLTMNIAGFIRTLGYNAIPSINCTALNIPLAIDAGLGQLGRNGKLINPHLGSRIRIAKVITDMPLIHDKPINFGVTEFCDACRKCARECPVGAIPSGTRTRQPVDELGNAHYLRWPVNHKKCFEYWSECGTNCNICLYVCSYNRGYKWTKGILNATHRDNSLIDTLLDGLEDDYGLELINKDSDDFWFKG
ncbi:MAG: reductive dehalogenase [Peptococcaceae bacterium BICA1-8]|nr:MAG: reductive dehalogenase [Peptococcaceae bacterium BICA1-8]